MWRPLLAGRNRDARAMMSAALLPFMRTRRNSYGVLGPYKIERYAKLAQRPKTVTTGLGSIKTTWMRVYSASNRLLGLENGWPFRRFGGGAAPPLRPRRPSRLLALSRTSRRALLTHRRAVRAPPP
eukprot:COSAG04_NODE_2867_length_3446_cov_28.508515_5_plen_126_part_00